MNVTALRTLTPRIYGRANYLKTEIMNLLRYVRVLAPNKRDEALAFMDEARTYVYDQLDEDLPATLPAGEVAVGNGDTVAIQRSSGTAVGAAGTAVVTAGVLTAVRPPATTALAVAGAQTGITVTGTYTSGVSFTVANGAITGITLS